MVYRIMNIATVRSILLVLLLIGCDKSVYDGSSPEEIILRADVFISSNPVGASIYLDGRITGFITPDTLRGVSVGDHAVVLKRKLYSDTSFAFTVPDEEVVNLNVDMTNNYRNFGEIRCSSTPSGASIFLNDSSTGLITPVVLENVPAGIHEVRCDLYNHRSDSIVVYLKSQGSAGFTAFLSDTTYWVDYNLSTTDIPTNEITDVAVKGNSIWFSTIYDGLIEFNGRNWIPHPLNDAQFAGKKINRLSIDNDNNLWVCIDGSMIRYDNGIQEVISSALLVPYFYELKFDSQNNFICATGNGLIKYDRSVWLNYADLFPENDISFVNDIEIVNDSTFYLGTISHRLPGEPQTTGRLYKIEGSSLSIVLDAPNYYYQYNIQQLEMDKNGKLWIGVTRSRYTSGSTIYQLVNNELTEYQLPGNIVNEMLRVQYNRFYIDSQNTMWIATETNLASITENNVGLVFDYSNSRLPRAGMSSVAVDKSNNVWVTTSGLGILKYKNGN